MLPIACELGDTRVELTVTDGQTGPRHWLRFVAQRHVEGEWRPIAGASAATLLTDDDPLPQLSKAASTIAFAVEMTLRRGDALEPITQRLSGLHVDVTGRLAERR
jgi:hypothetical protein